MLSGPRKKEILQIKKHVETQMGAKMKNRCGFENVSFAPWFQATQSFSYVQVFCLCCTSTPRTTFLIRVNCRIFLAAGNCDVTKWCQWQMRQAGNCDRGSRRGWKSQCYAIVG